jgi:hypothetical protein
MASSFWILASNSWMQVPVGHTIADGKIIPSDWKAVIGGPVFLIRWMHMLPAAFLATAMCVIAAGASYLLRGIHRAEAQVMMHWGGGARGGSDRNTVFLWAPERQVRLRTSTDQVCRHRGALAAPAARH